MTKRTKLLALILLCSTGLVLAQKSPIKFGDVPMEHLKMTSYDKDSSAIAVVLADYGQSNFLYNDEKGFYVKFERTTRIKIDLPLCPYEV